MRISDNADLAKAHKSAKSFWFYSLATRNQQDEEESSFAAWRSLLLLGLAVPAGKDGDLRQKKSEDEKDSASGLL